MLRKTALIMLIVILSLVFAVPAFAGGGPPPRDENGDRVRVVVYVTRARSSNSFRQEPIPIGRLAKPFQPNSDRVTLGM
jgi:hypothetical protein